MDTDSVTVPSRLRLITGGIAAIIIGFLSLYVMIAAWGAVSHVIDPTARIAAFLLRPPHHPVRLEIAGLILPASLGALIGIGLSFLVHWMDSFSRWLVWLLFIGGFISAILIAAPALHPWPMAALIRISLFMAASAAALARLPAGYRPLPNNR